MGGAGGRRHADPEPTLSIFPDHRAGRLLLLPQLTGASGEPPVRGLQGQAREESLAYIKVALDYSSVVWYTFPMDLRRRMELLTEAALPDREQGMPRYRQSVPIGNRPLTSMGIAQARLPGGGSINLMRVMQTNACSLSCGYCPTFCGGKVPRATVTPEEVATTFMDVSRKGLAQGLFLTSGVPGRPTRATDRMLATLELLRRRE